MNRTNSLKVGRDRQTLVSESQIGGDGDTVLADHGYDGATVQFHYRLRIMSQTMSTEVGGLTIVVARVQGWDA